MVKPNGTRSLRTIKPYEFEKIDIQSFDHA